MDTLEGKIQRIYEAAGMQRNTVYSHLYTSSTTPLYIRRIAYELEYAYRLSLTHGGSCREIVETAADRLLAHAASEGNLSSSVCAEAEIILAPLGEIAKDYTVHMVAHAHIDMNWMWPYHETVSVTLETFRTILQLMREYPDFTYAQSQASTYQIVEKYDPDMLEEIRQRVHEGRWEVSASTWVEADKNMPGDEAMVRHLLYTKEYLSQLLDIDPTGLNLDFEPDTFGHSANLPEILTQGGVKYYYHCRGYDRHPVYRWQARSGSEVLVFREPTWYLGSISPEFALYLPAFCKTNGLKDAIKVYGVGDHGGGPTRRDLNLIEEMKAWPIFPTLKYSSYREFFAKLEEKKDTFPVVKQELNFVFPGCYTTQCRIKASNRIGEAALTEAETLSSAAAGLTGRIPRTAAFTEAWRAILFNQFHDILTGSGVRDTREYALGAFSQSLACANTEKAAAMRAISGMIDTSSVSIPDLTGETTSEGAGVGYGCMSFGMGLAERGSSLTRLFHLFNPYDHERRENVPLAIWDYPGNLSESYAHTLDGTEVPVQLLSTHQEQYMGHVCQHVLVQATVPAFGWQTVVFETAAKKLPLEYPVEPRVHHPDEFFMENEYLRAEFDTVNGALVSLLDKETGREIISSPAGFFAIDEDTDKDMTSWIVGRYMRRELLAGNVRIRYASHGPLRQSLTVSAVFGNFGSALEYTVSLGKGSRHLEYDVKCDWKEVGTKSTCIPQLAFAVPYLGPSRLLYDIPAGSVHREPMDLDVPACHFAAALPDKGNTLMLSTDTKYGFRACRSTLQVTLIRASYDPDPYPERGLHQFHLYVSLRPERDTADLLRAAVDISRPMDYITALPHPGTLPAAGSFLSVSGKDIRLTCVKASQDGKAMILRLVNYGGPENACVRLTKAPAAAYLSNALEQPVTLLAPEGKTVSFPARGHSLITLRIE